MKAWLIGVALLMPATALAQSETRAGRLIDREVQNAAGQLLGEVEDLVIDMSSGRVQSVVLEADNPAREDRLHAYRLDDFSVGQGRRLRLNVEREALLRTRGFPKDLWPSWGEAYWRSEPGMRLMRAAELLGKELRDSNGAKAGEVQDLVIDLRGGAVTHAILDIAGSRRQARVPMKEIALAPNGEPALNVERAQLVERAAGEMRVTRLIDTEVENRQGRNLGELEDLVIDLAGASVQFAVLEFDSALDVGRRFFAYRLADFAIGDGRKLILDVQPAELRQGRGFHEESWPPWSEPYWSAYQPEPGGRSVPPVSAAAGSTAPAMPLRARELLGKPVRQRDGAEIGEIDDLVVDLRSGALTHAIIDIGKSLQQARVPIDALAMDMDTGDVTLGIEREQLLTQARTLP